MNRFCIAFSLATVSALVVTPSYAQDAAAGQAVFKQACSICHDVAPGKNRIGPSLFGVVGRPAGSAENFHYSDGNKKSGLTWDTATLDKYLAAPRATVPGTTMSYGGLKDDQKRHDLIAYLATLH